MRAIKKILVFGSLILIVYYSTYWFLFTVDTIKTNSDSDYIKGAISAFIGALFAFVLYGFGVLLGKIYRRVLKHVNAIALLEQQLNYILVRNYDNLIILSKFVTSIENGMLYSMNLKTYEVSDSITRNLGNIEFSNEVFNFKVEVYKNNESIATVTNFYNDFKRLFLDGKIDRDTFYLNIRGDFKNDIIFLKKVLEEFDQKTEQLMAKSQAMFEFDEPTLFWIIRVLAINGRRSEKFNQFYKERLFILKTVRQKNLDNSIKEIKNTQAKCKSNS